MNKEELKELDEIIMNLLGLHEFRCYKPEDRTTYTIAMNYLLRNRPLDLELVP